MHDSAEFAPELMDAEQQSGHIVVVLGMHRSGTSTIARALKALGIPLGENLHPGGFDNPKGFWEDRDCLEINEELLRHLGSNYAGLHMTRQFSLTGFDMSDLRIRAAQTLKQNLSIGGGIWGFKDPRTCRLLEFWHPIMAAAGYKITFVIAIRNPISVARSLELRDQIPPEKAYLLWLQHMVPALLSSKGPSRRIVVDYDRMMDRPLLELQRMADAIELQVDFSLAQVTDFTSDFLDTSLRHTQFSVGDLSLDSRIPISVSDSYRVLLDVAKDVVSIDSEVVQQHFLGVANILDDMRAAFSYVNMLEQEGNILRDTVSDQAEKLSRMTDSVKQFEQQLAIQLNLKDLANQERAAQQDRAEVAEQHWAAQQHRAEVAEQQHAAQQQRAELAEQHWAAQQHRAEVAEQQHAAQQSRAERAEEAVDSLRTALQALDVQRADALSRLTAIEKSSSWRATAPIRLILGADNSFARVIRKGAKVFWWSVTFQLPRRLRERRMSRSPNKMQSKSTQFPIEPSDLHASSDLSEAPKELADLQSKTDLPDAAEHNDKNS